MHDKKQQIKCVLVLLCCIVYSVTNMYEHFNLWFLVLLSVVAGTLIHYSVEFIFAVIKKYRSPK